MDLNEDGNIDILSGSYSRMGGEMAGLFQVLWGTDDGAYLPAKELTGIDGEPLIIPADEEHMTDRICTRPTAVDIDGNGTLDLIAGNFTGTFYLFEGLGEGKFKPTGEFLMAGEDRVAVPAHGDPCCVDWDGDGDLDILSGSARGGVLYIENAGTEMIPQFRQARQLIAAAENPNRRVIGKAHVTGPQGSTRVWVDDIDGDGKLDLLVGDSLTLYSPLEGNTVSEAESNLVAWQTRSGELQNAMSLAADPEAMNEAQEAFSEHYGKLAEAVVSDATGFVWLYRQM